VRRSLDLNFCILPIHELVELPLDLVVDLQPPQRLVLWLALLALPSFLLPLGLSVLDCTALLDKASAHAFLLSELVERVVDVVNNHVHHFSRAESVCLQIGCIDSRLHIFFLPRSPKNSLLD
jgi:hypothetical protein